MSGDADKAAQEIRQGFGVLCVAAVLAILGFALDGDVADVLRAAGGLAVILGFAVLAYALLVRNRG